MLINFTEFLKKNLEMKYLKKKELQQQQQQFKMIKYLHRVSAY